MMEEDTPKHCPACKREIKFTGFNTHEDEDGTAFAVIPCYCEHCKKKYAIVFDLSKE